jgi:hypothetical protein
MTIRTIGFRFVGCGFLTLWPLLLSAGSIDQGKRLYSQHCVVCHGAYPDYIRPNVKIGASNPGYIRATIKTQPQMSFLASLTDQELGHMASYLEYPDSSDVDCIFNWAEALLPAVLPSRPASLSAQGYTYRFYPSTKVYVASKNGELLFWDTRTNAVPTNLGQQSLFYSQALQAGCP